MKRKQFYACALAIALAAGPMGTTAYAQTLTAQPGVAD
jgi:hypothetical protein